jgi:hypothetical protein
VANNGALAFASGLPGSIFATDDDESIWYVDQGGLRKVMTVADTPPGLPSKRLQNFDLTVVAAGFRGAAFEGDVLGFGVTSSQNVGLWSEHNGTLEYVAAIGNQAPHIADGAIFDRIHDPVINQDLAIAFQGWLYGGGLSDKKGIWSGTPGNLRLVALDDAPPESGRPNLRFGFFTNPASPSLNTSGEVAFRAGVAEEVTPTFYRESVWVEEDNQLRLAALSGDPAPGIMGTTFGYFEGFALDDNGYLSLVAWIDAEDAIGQQFPGIWVYKDNSLRLVTRRGATVPGGGPTEKFHQFDSVNVDAQGHAAFRSYVLDSQTSNVVPGIWAESDSGLNLVARAGQQAPGVMDGAIFADIRPPVQNDLGQVAFYATLIGPGVTNANREGIWAQDARGTLRVIARAGQAIDVDDGPGVDLRTISFLAMRYGNTRAEGVRSFNDVGQLGFWARFTDGTEGVFLSNLVAVPEPSGHSLIAIGIAFLLPLSGIVRNGLMRPGPRLRSRSPQSPTVTTSAGMC